MVCPPRGLGSTFAPFLNSSELVDVIQLVKLDLKYGREDKKGTLREREVD